MFYALSTCLKGLYLHIHREGKERENGEKDNGKKAAPMEKDL
jgi:hypothetical protein